MLTIGQLALARYRSLNSSGQGSMTLHIATKLRVSGLTAPFVHRPSLSLHKVLGKIDRSMPVANATDIIRKPFIGSADAGVVDEGTANLLAKSLRCGGVSQATAEEIRDGVTQSHGGWQQRTSLVHYDAIRPTSALDVSMCLVH